MNNIILLTNLPIMKKGKIESMECTGSVRRRLLDLGLVNNSYIIPILNSPSKGLRAFDIRGILIAIRDEDASLVSVSF